MSTLAVSAYTALATIVGYLGTEVGSTSIFDRLLWPSRFYNLDWQFIPALGILTLVPMGGPIHKAAVEVLDHFLRCGLWGGSRKGDMLGSAFFHKTDHRWIECTGNNGGAVEEKEARNAFWITVLSLIPPPRESKHKDASDEEVAPGRRAESRNERPVYCLTLSWQGLRIPDAETPVVVGDIGPIKLRYFVGIVASELTTLAFGIATAVLYKSPYASWYLAPLVFKLIALVASVQRTTLKRTIPIVQENEPDNSNKHMPAPVYRQGNANGQQPSFDDAMILCRIVDFSAGFFLIYGPRDLVLQFFRHYGHPVRNRLRELICMFTIILFLFVYPAGILAFIFAPTKVQWIWLGYMLYAMVAMQVYRFGGVSYVGTTQSRLAKELGHHGKVIFDDSSGNKIFAELTRCMVNTVNEGRREVDRQAREILDAAQNIDA
ncbi:hypothetical protein F4821DRAFT_275885 [Hypoxylon rubiginosum]|uniref:Uncharacterized protein n=1 Tax=Hypoxylon rubiginosum TaxID=110542 RepID=A0ACC0D9H8_9PEZI|nr:hypothetical protein F4821DRAFT_275885 [Hypoxylon rubiginosum]